MKRTLRILPVALLPLLASYAHAKEPTNFNASVEAQPIAAAPSSPTASPLGFVASRDAKRGVPTFFWAARPASTTSSPVPALTGGWEALARSYMNDVAEIYGLSRPARDTIYVRHIHDTGTGGVIVIFGQKIDGAPVFQTEMKILMNRSGELVAIGGNLHADATPKGKGRSFKLSDAQAIAIAFTDRYDTPLSASDLIDRKEERNGYHYFDLKATPKTAAKKLAFTTPSRAQKVFFPMPDRIVPAYYLELHVGREDSTSSDLFGYVIAADTGELLLRRNLTSDIAFNYKVWADGAAPYAPTDGPQADYTPHPTGLPDGSSPPFVAPGMVSIESFNTAPGGAIDSWLPANATQSTGNNVDAYADRSMPDGFGGINDLRATTTSANTFDRAYDTTLAAAASQNQIRASVTQLFYNVNWMHDFWYDSGFNEGAGNAQTSNFGRGGAEGDALHAEAQDYSGTNNANMSTPADGASPVMQMYVWDGKATTTLNVQPINLSPANQGAAFGPGTFNVTAQLILGVDNAADVNDLCSNPTNNVTGKIVLVNRGTCTFESKVKRAQNAGAVGVLITNNVAQGLPGMADDTQTNGVTIGSLGISQADGDTLKTQLMNQTLTVTMSSLPAVQRDGTIDNTIVSHEWGHYLHQRLVACGSNECGGESEGWGDFNALMIAIDPGDNLDTGTFALATYATANLGDAGYFGIRRFPYTRDMAKNGLTFKHVADAAALPAGPNQDNGVNNWEAHNAGEVWASMMFQAYSELQLNGGHTFTESKRRMANYVVAGMQMAPANPTFTEQRDGILAAAAAADPADFQLLAQGFATRGAGTCAVSPDTNSNDGSGVVEDFTVSGQPALASAKIDDSIVSCDGDGLLDGLETGKLTIGVLNSGAGTLTNTSVTVTTAAAGVTFPNGNTATIASIPPYTTGTATVNVALDNSFAAITDADFTIALSNASACNPNTQATAALRLNYDDTPMSSTTEDVESPVAPWVKWGAPGFTDLVDDIWTRNKQANNNYRWFGQDFPAYSDTALESPDLVVSANQAFSITFAHAFDFEASQQGGVFTYWDGGVIEITKNGGQLWEDVSMYANPGYNNKISAVAQDNNPLAGRNGFVRRNAAWPNTNNVTLDFGNAFAGQTVKIRFRIGTDEAGGFPQAQGWYFDNIAVSGVTNMPFNTVTADPMGCDNNPPVANAGPDQVVNEGDIVTLNASMSSDSDNDPLSYGWSQPVGPNVMLSDPAIVMPTFTAPQVDADTVLTFAVNVGDGKVSAMDTVDVLVKDVPVTSGAGGAGGGTGAGGGSSSSVGAGTGGGASSSVGAGGMSSGTGEVGGSTGTGPRIDPDSSGGCGCEVPGRSSEAPATSFVASLLAALAIVSRRRRDRSIS